MLFKDSTYAFSEKHVRFFVKARTPFSHSIFPHFIIEGLSTDI